MAISVTRKQITTLAKAIDIPGLGYLHKLNMIANSFGYENEAAMMATLNAQDTTGASRDTISARLEDWRQPEDVGLEDAAINAPIGFSMKASPVALDIFLSGPGDDIDETGTSLRIEREGNMTRFMLYDGLCDAPRVFGVPDGDALAELPNDWEKTDPKQEGPQP